MDSTLAIRCGTHWRLAVPGGGPGSGLTQPSGVPVVAIHSFKVLGVPDSPVPPGLPTFRDKHIMHV